MKENKQAVEKNDWFSENIKIFTDLKPDTKTDVTLTKK